MKKSHILRCRYLFLPVLCFLMQFSITAEARDIYFLISGDGTVRSVDGSMLFADVVMYPGFSGKASLEMINLFRSDTWYRQRFVTDGTENAFSGSLMLSVKDSHGNTVYDGPLTGTDLCGGPVTAPGSEKLIYDLYMPGTAGNECSDQEFEFRLETVFSDRKELLFNDEDEHGRENEDRGDGDDNSGDSDPDDGSGSPDPDPESETDPESGSKPGRDDDTDPGTEDKNNGKTDDKTDNKTDGKTDGKSEGKTGNKDDGKTDVKTDGRSESDPGQNSGSVSHGQSGGGGWSREGETPPVRVIGTDGTVHDYPGSFRIPELEDPFSNGIENAAANIGFVSAANVTGGAFRRVYDEPSPLVSEGTDEGEWEETSRGRRYILNDGTYIKNGWALVRAPYGAVKEYAWYFFDEKGWAAVGWIKAEDHVWYHTCDKDGPDKGALETGWHYEIQDGRLYLLDPESGKMCSGRKRIRISGKGEWDYYFAGLEDTYRQNWFFSTSIGGWLYDRLGMRSYGSMYIGEVTPDGGMTDAYGRYV